MSKTKSLKAAAEQLGVSDTTIKKWLRNGAPGKSDGHYDCAALAKWREENIRHKIDVSPPSEATSAKAREAAARAEHWELRVAQAKGKLIDADETRAAIQEHYAYARALVVDLPGRLLARVELKSGTKAKAMELLRDVADDFLTSLSEGIRAVDRVSEESATRHSTAIAGRPPQKRRQ